MLICDLCTLVSSLLNIKYMNKCSEKNLGPPSGNETHNLSVNCLVLEVLICR